MRIEYTGRQTEVPKHLRALAERKLKKLARVLHGITDAHVVLASDKHRQIAEVSIRSPHLVLAATNASPDAGTSLSTAIEKLTRQAQRHMGKRREPRRRGPVRGPTRFDAGAETGAGEPGSSRRIVRSRSYIAKPMSVEDAARRVEGSAHGFVVFRNAGTERVSVLYRRKDGHLGLIEPEA
jgi:ribosome hibernation promoting factor